MLRKLLLTPLMLLTDPQKFKNSKIPPILSLIWMGLCISKWALILEDKFSLSGNVKCYKARKGKKDFMQEEDGIITFEIS
jgi:hypothetical protein